MASVSLEKEKGCMAELANLSQKLAVEVAVLGRKVPFQVVLGPCTLELHQLLECLGREEAG